ncbi:MAG TPA: hypothetical protein VN132_02565, partial [Bdellovibrio sp.]|nr:hypothetical protein [Bdellovibrio sp.]
MVPEQAVLQQIQKKCSRTSLQANDLRDASLNDFNPAPAVVLNVPLPGTQKVLFRGIRPENLQFDDVTVIKTLLGKQFYLPSPMMWGIEMLFTKERTLDGVFIPQGGLPLSMSEYLKSRGLLRDVEILLECHQQTPFSELEISIIGKSLMNRYYANISKSDVDARYLNIKDPQYYNRQVQNLGYGNNAIDLIISSYYDQIASFYGNKILVLKDFKNRSVDLGYFNYTLNGKFWDMWIDNGEVDTPGYLNPRDILGYQQRLKNRDPKNKGIYQTHNPILYGIYKWKIADRDYIVVLSGLNKLCMLQDEHNQRVYFCEDNWEKVLLQGPIPYPFVKNNSDSNKAPILGVLSNCGDKKSCDPEAVLKAYGADISLHSRAKLGESKDILAHFSEIATKLNMTFTPNAELDKPLVADNSGDVAIQVVEATFYPVSKANQKDTYQGNATEKAKAFANGKTKSLYKISWRHLGIPTNKESMAFEISWKCKNDGEIRTAKVAANAENKVIQISCEENP